MSAGRLHTRPNFKRPKDAEKIMGEGDTSTLAQRWKGINVEHDVPDLVGYDVSGTWVYLDRDFFRALLDPAYATHVIGRPIDTGLTQDDTVDCLVTFAHVEKQVLDGDNANDDFAGAHEHARIAEHEEVRKRGGTPLRFEAGLAKIAKFCELKAVHQVAKDFDCAPLLDEPDQQDRRQLAMMRQLGVVDAGKESKRAVDYSVSTGKDRCDGCQFWQEDRGQALSTCAKVEGLVRKDRWCKRYQALPHTVPESRATLLAQQKQLQQGHRRVQMFPHGTPELPVPQGMRRVAGKNGAFHYDPAKIHPNTIRQASAADRENDLLDLGPYSKHDVMQRIGAGEPPLAVVERDPQGTEVRAAAGTHSTAQTQLAAMHRTKSPGHTVAIEKAEDVIAHRAKGGPLEAGQPAVVGEKGREAFVPTRPAGQDDQAGDEKAEELSDEPNPPAPKKSWGFHLIIDMSGCNKKADDEAEVKRFFADLIKTLGMKTLTDTIVVRPSAEEGRGITAVQVITTSSITYHEDDDLMAVYLDVFTCKWVDDFENKVLSLAEERFTPKHIGHQMIYRDAGRNAGPAPKPRAA